MTFLVPTALALAAFALPITVLYILKLRMRQVPVSSDLFWQQIFQARPPRSFWNRFRHPLSWLAQLLILLTIVAAAGDPRWLSDSPPHSLVLIIDVSASMQATEAGGQRLTLATNQAHRIINGLPPGSQAAVIAADHRAEVVCGMTDHIPDLLRAVSGIQPSAAPGSPELAIRAAAELLGQTPAGEIILLTDRCFDSPGLTDNPRLTILSIATPRSNIGITNCQSLRNPDDPLAAELLIAVTNSSPHIAEATLELRISGTLSSVLRLKLSPNESTTRSFPRVGPSGGIWQAELKNIRFSADSDASALPQDDTASATDALTIDNSAVAILPDAPRQRVLLVSPGSLFVQKVLEADPLTELTVLQQPPPDNAWPQDHTVVLHETIPRQLPGGPVIVLDPRNDCDAWNIRGTRENPLPAQSVETHPITRNFRLDDVLIPAASELEFTQQPRILAAAEDGLPLCCLLQRPQGQVVVIPLHLTQSDLAFRTVFPILMSNTLRWLAGHSDPTASALQAGQQTAVPLPLTAPATSIPNSLLRSPAGKLTRIPLVPDTAAPLSATALTGPLREAGLWLIEPNGSNAPPNADSTSAVPIAVNVASSMETDLRPRLSARMSPESPPKAVPAAGRPPWFWLCLATVLLLASEWFLYQRRWIT
jgi:hypothetical protein